MVTVSERHSKNPPQTSTVKENKTVSVTGGKRSKSKKQTLKGIAAKDNIHGIRVRKIFMSSGGHHKGASPMTAPSTMGKTTQGKTGFNLLTTSKEFKGHGNHLLAPVKQRSTNKKMQPRGDRSGSIQSPRILNNRIKT